MRPAAAASRGWPWLDDKLTSHRRYGPIIVRWRERRAIPRSAKLFAIAGMVLFALGIDAVTYLFAGFISH